MKKFRFGCLLLVLLVILSALVACTGEGVETPETKEEKTVENVTKTQDTGKEEVTTAGEQDSESTTEAVTYNYDELDTDGKWTKRY